MKKTILLTVLFSFCFSAIFCQTKYWQQQVNYTIDVTLNDTAHTLDGYVKMDYYNNSPDTLFFIWIHAWPNAYKNDRTAFSDQLLQNGRTDFYFSNEDKRGYINRLDFKVNGQLAPLQDHPEHQDIFKLLLPQPLTPHSTAKIETPFHLKLPYNFSRGGHVGQAYQITQWYPKPAVYDRKGWHAMPYLDQGEFYSEFGNYEVQITLPANYVVAATGELVSETTSPVGLKTKFVQQVIITPKHPPFLKKKKAPDNSILSATNTKTLVYKQANVHDFAWFADKSFIVKKDSLQLPSGRAIQVATYYQPGQADIWKNSLQYIKQAVITRSSFLGEYPYSTVTAVEVEMGFDGGMEYPTITSISPVKSSAALESVLEHEVGHNWNYGILATNERMHPWMDEGINTYYDNRYYSAGKNIVPQNEDARNRRYLESRMPADHDQFIAANLYDSKKDQPIETESQNFNETNYNTIAYYKTGKWMEMLEEHLGRAIFDSCMHTYYQRWQFKHPYPEDLQKVFEEVSGKDLGADFTLLNKKGQLPQKAVKKDIKFASLFSFNNTDKHHYVFVAPAIGTNIYDKLMMGVLIHNYTLPAEKFQFFLAPMYATGSRQLNGLGRISYHWYNGSNGANTAISFSGETFSNDSFTDSAGNKKTFRFSKLVPSVKYTFRRKNALSTTTKFIQWKTFLIEEQGLLFTKDTVQQQNIITYPTASRYLNQLRFVLANSRVLYPYNTELLTEQGEGFLRLAFTGNYYFNYAKEGGLNLRLFAGKFIYLGDKTYLKQFETDAYHLNMSGPKGYEDYTYSNYFAGRNEFNGWASQQIMNRDGFFKVRTDFLSSKVGKTDNWLMAANFTTDIPKAINILQLLPVKIPLKAFVDVGTYAESWQKNAATGRFIYDAGLQLSFFKDVVQVYVPLLYSKVYRDYFKSTIPEKRFLKNISFSIDIQNFSLKKVVPQIAF
ncbi:M1 family metallopeptidase [Ferruginibacter paludis]|uniref:M1 family metallopeptidase n=1 Tax=Ferruginibacter paludis TaxID=1310417 RepID=UPI0025B56ED9|nr:M1 family metallopeptidase [Ferruginibacter paludis]MDN3654156.1 M1 family metallopeptidase [Ferruginibacter paludis]